MKNLLLLHIEVLIGQTTIIPPKPNQKSHILRAMAINHLLIKREADQDSEPFLPVHPLDPPQSAPFLPNGLDLEVLLRAMVIAGMNSQTTKIYLISALLPPLQSVRPYLHREEDLHRQLDVTPQLAREKDEEGNQAPTYPHRALGAVIVVQTHLLLQERAKEVQMLGAFRRGGANEAQTDMIPEMNPHVVADAMIVLISPDTDDKIIVPSIVAEKVQIGVMMIDTEMVYEDMTPETTDVDSIANPIDTANTMIINTRKSVEDPTTIGMKTIGMLSRNVPGMMKITIVQVHPNLLTEEEEEERREVCEKCQLTK